MLANSVIIPSQRRTLCNSKISGILRFEKSVIPTEGAGSRKMSPPTYLERHTDLSPPVVLGPSTKISIIVFTFFEIWISAKEADFRLIRDLPQVRQNRVRISTKRDWINYFNRKLQKSEKSTKRLRNGTKCSKNRAKRSKNEMNDAKSFSGIFLQCTTSAI